MVPELPQNVLSSWTLALSELTCSKRTESQPRQDRVSLSVTLSMSLGYSGTPYHDSVLPSPTQGRQLAQRRTSRRRSSADSGWPSSDPRCATAGEVVEAVWGEPGPDTAGAGHAGRTGNVVCGAAVPSASNARISWFSDGDSCGRLGGPRLCAAAPATYRCALNASRR